MKRKLSKSKKQRKHKNKKTHSKTKTRRQRGGAHTIENVDLQESLAYPIDRMEYYIIERNPDASTPYEFSGRAVATVVQPPQSADLRFPPLPKVSYRWTNGTLKTINPDGSIDVYEGNLNDRIKHGHGKQTWSNGTVYEGNWENNVISGVGRLTDPLPLGEVMYIPTYQGNFENNQKSGHGTMIYADGSVYTGDWQNDTMHGNGRIQYKDGDIYVGSWVNDIKHGKGKQSYHDDPDFTEYEGDFENEEPHGKGTMKFRDGSRYEGDWVQGQMHGVGNAFDAKNNHLFQANFINNEPQFEPHVEEMELHPTLAYNPVNIFQNQQNPPQSGNIFGSRPDFFEPPQRRQ
jgi:hypothetical protein